MAGLQEQFFVHTNAARHFDDKGSTVCSLECDRSSFLAHLQKAYAEGAPMVDGYAPFCKHIFIPNFVGLNLAITSRAA